jgi:hypothetical protein
VRRGVRTVGGCVTDVWAGAESSDELWKFMTTSKTWELVTRSRPTARHDHAMAAIGTDIFVHGGARFYCCRPRNGENTTYEGFSDELWKYSTSTATWVKLTPTGDTPGERRGHAMVAVSNFLFLFGGARGQKVAVSDSTPQSFPSPLSPAELWKYSKDTSTWELLWAGDEPRQRYDHAMAVVGADVVIHGGRVGLAHTRSGE